MQPRDNSGSINFVEVIGNYDKSQQGKGRIIAIGLTIFAIVLFIGFNSLAENFSQLTSIFQAEPSATLQRSTFGNRTEASSTPEIIPSTVAPSPTAQLVEPTMTSNVAFTETGPTAMPSPTAMSAVEATRQSRSNAVQDAIRNRN